ncbi:unnamed protein product [Soboliphyme baturini]|uniref:Thioredoxin domain-containing protein 17 n=1 Tax=Soboliphyme baturini TaxID=241478 RepID=A0A183IGH0_9BILA|nr:unnamed protein product [Soboliphyme baturini]
MHVAEYGPFKAIDDILTLRKFSSQVPTEKGIFVLLCGTRDEYGRSWCPACERLVTHLKQVAQKVLPRAEMVYVQVGNRSELRNENNPFKKYEETKLNKVPTLLNWRTGQRLNSAEAADYAKVDEFLGINRHG